MNYTKECVKIGRRSHCSTHDYINAYGIQVTAENEVLCGNKDVLIMIMANTIMELTRKGKFNLRDFGQS